MTTRILAEFALISFLESRVRGQPELRRLRCEEIITYAVVGWLIRSLYFNNIDRAMAMDILEGKVSMAADRGAQSLSPASPTPHR